ncbi:MAG: SEC-C domain-containing protein [Cyclobacteriaceae bacterium]
MTKIGRNDPCPCGSGKKYKHCHIDTEVSIPEVRDMPKPDKRNIQHLFDNCKALNSVIVLGALQLFPSNHGRNFHMEELANEFLRRVEKNKGLRPPAWTELESIIPTCGAGLYVEPPLNPFTTNVIFRNGNNTVYPGIYNHGTHILNEMIRVLHHDKSLPEGFTKMVSQGIGVLLEMSHQIALQLGHTRYMDVVNESERIEFPGYEEGIKTISAITFTKDDVIAICDRYEISPEVITEFLVDADLKNDDPENNILITKPLLKDGDDIVVYSPTTIVSSLIHFAYDQSVKHNCDTEFMKALQDEQLSVAKKAFHEMNWSLTGIQLPTSPNPLHADELVCMFDNQKLAYVCFLRKNVDAKRTSEMLEERKKVVFEYLKTINPDQPSDVLTLYVYPDIGENVFWKWDKPTDANYSLMFGVHELQLIASREHTNALTLWKFAKALYHAGEKVKFLCRGGLTELFSIFEFNRGSLLHPTAVTGIDGVQPIESDYASDLFTEHYVRRDEHAIMTKFEGTVGFFQVIRYRKYAPIYTIDTGDESPYLILDGFRMPIWFKTEQDNGKNSKWAHYIADTIAFWLWRMKDELAHVLEEQSFFKLEFEIVVDQSLDNEKDFIIKDFPENVELRIETAPMKIRLLIPFDFIYEAWKSNNQADRLLLKTALNGLIQYIREAGKDIKLTPEDTDRIIEKIMIPENAKMILFNDSSYDVRLDDRNLPPVHYIPEADESMVLENIVSWLPNGYSIPEEITDVEQKKKMFDDLVAVLVERISKKLETMDGPKLLEWLIRLNERCTQIKEFREILIPAKIACFSEFDDEVSYLQDEKKDVVATSHALRTVIEFVATKIPSGTKWPNYDDIDELLAMVHQLTNFGALREAITFGFADPEMGLLPSGRIGIDKSFEQDVLTPFFEAKTEGTVLGYVEHFESKYQASHRKEETQQDRDTELDAAFLEEYGIELPALIRIVCELRDYGFEKGQGFIRILKKDAVTMVLKKYPEITESQVHQIIQFLTLLERLSIGKPPEGYGSQDIFPWRFNRPISYLRRPLVNYKDEKGDDYLYYGYRHLVSYLDHLFYLIYNGKLPERKSQKMRDYMGAILGEKGTPFRNEAKNWFRKNSKLEVIEHEIPIYKLSGNEKDREFGDIDLLVIDTVNKVFYPIECKHKSGARNILEMKREMDDFFGRDGKTKDAKLLKHEKRDAWIKNNLPLMKSFVNDPESYRVRSLLLSAEEIAIGFLAKDSEMPIVLFNQLKLKGDSIITNPPAK